MEKKKQTVAELKIAGAKASSTHWALLFGAARSPYRAANVLTADPAQTWNAGRFADVRLTLTLADEGAVVGVRIVPDMRARLLGTVELLVRGDPNDTILAAHRSLWADRTPVAVEWVAPRITRTVTLEFVQSPTWVALRHVAVLGRRAEEEEGAGADNNE